MSSILDSSLHTTKSSVDFGTTLEEPFFPNDTPSKCLTEEALEKRGEFTDVSCVTIFSSPWFKRTAGPHPYIPIIPEAKLAISIDEMAAALTRTLDSAQERLKTMSSKRQVLEFRLNRLQTRTDSLRIRDQQIKRRHTEIRRKRSKMAANISNSSEDSTPSEDERRRYESGDIISSESEDIPGLFYRNSVVRKAKVWKNRRSPITTTVDLSFHHSKTEQLPVSELPIETPTPVQITHQPPRKVRKPKSFSLKKFIQKKIKAFV